MSEILNLQQKIQETGALIAQTERAFAADPTSFGLQLSLRSLEKHKRDLEEEFRQVAAQIGVEVCTYRIIPAEGAAKIGGLTSAIGDYQSLVSLFYDAIKHGPKRNARLSPDIPSETSFDFGYAFAGSVGFVFTLPAEKTLYEVMAPLEESMKLILEVSKAETTEDILKHARKLGPAPIRAIYKWADVHVKSLFDVGIELRRGEEIRGRFSMQKAEFIRLQNVIAQTSEDDYAEIDVLGTLLAVDVGRRTFRVQPDGRIPIITGSFSIGIDESHPVAIPGRYELRLGQTTRIQYSTEEEEVWYELLGMKPANEKLPAT